MILTGAEIKNQITKGTIVINPFDPACVNSNSVDLHLGDELRMYSGDIVNEGNRKIALTSDAFGGRLAGVIDSKRPPVTKVVPLILHPVTREDCWILRPATLYLGVTREYTESWGLIPYLDGRSSTGRLGIFTHVTAGRGDNGFCGRWTLEIVVVEPTIIYPGQRLVQITYFESRGDQTFYGSTNNRSGRYQHQMCPTHALMDDVSEGGWVPIADLGERLHSNAPVVDDRGQHGVVTYTGPLLENPDSDQDPEEKTPERQGDVYIGILWSDGRKSEGWLAGMRGIYSLPG